MFTGIIERLGRVTARRQAAGGVRLEVAPDPPLERPVVGESIAVSGACLTVEPESKADRLVFFLSGETLDRTTLGSLAPGASVNLERALAADGRLGGHLVQGHVDAVGTIRRWDVRGEAGLLEVDYPAELAVFIVPKGSVAVDGVSLTVAEAREQAFTVAVIPHTIQATTLREARPGARVNLEADMLARYVARALEVYGGGAAGGLTAEKLRDAGF